MNEKMPNDNLNPYSLTKLAGEELIMMYYKIWGLPTIALRYFNVYGERMPTTGIYAPVLGIFLRQKTANEPVTVVGDGNQRRDFIHVKDVVAANILAATVTDKKAFGQAYNIGSGTNISILKLTQIIEKNHSNIKFLPKRVGEAKNTLADIRKAKKLLQFKPCINLLDWLNKQI